MFRIQRRIFAMQCPFRQDHLALAALRPRLARMAHLMQRMEDTERALGSDIVAAALEVYAVLKVAGKDKGVDDARRELASRFSRRRGASDAAQGEPSPA